MTKRATLLKHSSLHTIVPPASILMQHQLITMNPLIFLTTQTLLLIQVMLMICFKERKTKIMDANIQIHQTSPSIELPQVIRNITRCRITYSLLWHAEPEPSTAYSRYLDDLLQLTSSESSSDSMRKHSTCNYSSLSGHSFVDTTHPNTNKYSYTDYALPQQKYSSSSHDDSSSNSYTFPDYRYSTIY